MIICHMSRPSCHKACKHVKKYSKVQHEESSLHYGNPMRQNIMATPLDNTSCIRNFTKRNFLIGTNHFITKRNFINICQTKLLEQESLENNHTTLINSQHSKHNGQACELPNFLLYKNVVLDNQHTTFGAS